MIRFLFRFLGFWLMAGAFVALVVDGTRSIAATDIVYTSTYRAWFSISPGTYEAVQAKITALSPLVWAHVGEPLLNLPLFVLLGVVGAVLLSIGRVRERSPFEAA